MQFLSDLFEPPYYAVIFSSIRTPADPEGYAEAAVRMMERAAAAPGYLGAEALGAGKLGLTVSYWRDEASIAKWKRDAEHAEVRATGRETWYQDFRLRVAKVERSYGLTSHEGGA